jgi:hypothetical protein
MFENKPAIVIANRNEAKIELAGLEVGPFEEGREYELPFWVAQELDRAGVVRFREDDILNVVKLHKVHWRERVQPSTRVSPLPPEFYPRLNRYLEQLKNRSHDPEKRSEYEKSLKIAQDIVNSRIKKLVSLSSSPPVATNILKNLSNEEQAFYHHLHQTVTEWKRSILKVNDYHDRRD